MHRLVSASVSHHNVDIEGIEKVRFGDVEGALKGMLSMPGVEEAMILQTCNRVEVYAVMDDHDMLRTFFKMEGKPMDAMSIMSGENAVRHLLTLGCGLESMIVGEDQIIGQIKDAYLLSEKHGATGPVLSAVALKAVTAGRRARNETRINKGSVSIGSAAVDLAAAIVGDLSDKHILVVGAGEMGTLVATALASKGLKGIYVANRTYEQAQRLAGSLGGIAVRLDDICDYLHCADVLICATGAPHIIVSSTMVESKIPERNGRKLLIIDITNPRNVEESVASLPCVELHNIDSLRSISNGNLKKRLDEVPKVERIIDEEMKMLDRELRRMRADRVIGDLYQKTDSLRQTELSRAVSRLSARQSLSAEQLAILDEFSAALMSKMLAIPTIRLRMAAESGDESYMALARELFDLGEGEGNELSGNEAQKAKTE